MQHVATGPTSPPAYITPGAQNATRSQPAGPDRNYPWRDLKIVRLNYSSAGGELVYSNAGVWTVNLDGHFTAASSEHSPQWGPSEPGANCQRIAFSQSSDSGRNLYLLDIGSGPLDDSCDIKASTPLLISARNTRALDWK